MTDTAVPTTAAPPGAPAQKPLHTSEPVDIVCADGVRLRGHFFGAAAGVPRPLPVLISPATGVRQEFYGHFADWLARAGYHVLVFDYRGVGQSLHGPLAQCDAQLAHWGQRDQVAALQWLLARSQAPQALLVGHSAGGQMLGLLPNHAQVARLVGVATSTGWFGGMRPGFALKARLSLRVLLPLATRWLGYAPTARIGLGENLPAAVARQWGQWCAAGGYATNAVRGRPAQDFHAQVRTPVTVLYATDDDIATPATVHDLLRTWPAAPHQAVAVRPADHGLRSIGHIHWFRPSHRVLWPLIGAALRGETA